MQYPGTKGAKRARSRILMSPKTWRPSRCVDHLSTFKEPVKTRVRNLSTIHWFCVGSVAAVRTCISILCSLLPCFAPWFSLVFASMYFDYCTWISILQFWIFIWLRHLRNRFIWFSRTIWHTYYWYNHTTSVFPLSFIKCNYHISRLCKKD